MKANYQVALFPFSPLNVSQGEDGRYSHAGTLNIDFANGDRFPVYAPCDCKCVDIFDPNANTRDFESLNKVMLANSTIDYLSFSIVHDNNPIAAVGNTFKQGELIGHAGNAGHATGVHCHLNVAKGKYQGHYKTPQGTWTLKNSMHIYDALYLYKIEVKNGGGYPWRTIDHIINVPDTTEKRKVKKVKHVINYLYKL